MQSVEDLSPRKAKVIQVIADLTGNIQKGDVTVTDTQNQGECWVRKKEKLAA